MEVIKGAIKVIEIIPNEDGSAELVLEVSDEFKKEFKSVYGFKRFSKKAFEKFVIEALEDTCRKRIKAP